MDSYFCCFSDISNKNGQDQSKQAKTKQLLKVVDERQKQ